MGKLHLTPEILRAVYDYLRATPPFNRWKLPAADNVEMHIVRTRNYQGQCIIDGTRHIIQISTGKICRTQALIEVMAHEMVHLHCGRSGIKPHHGLEWRRFARSVCEYYGFDPKLF